MRKICWILVLCLLTTAVFAGCAEHHIHSYGEWEIKEEPSCEEAGYKVRECECGEEDERRIPQLEHAYEITEDVAASCQGEGLQTFTCSACQDSYTETLAQVSYTSTEIHNMYLNVVGEIVTYDKNGEEYAIGTCFVYEDGGKLVTNYHVIEGAYSAEVTFGEETFDIRKVLAYDKEVDVAVLSISQSNLKPATVCDEIHSVGEVVYAFGNSQGLTSTFSDGMITHADREIDGIHYVQHDAPISSGNSGGPLINVYGEVIGINTWTLQDSQNLNFAISVTELEKLDYSNPLTMKQFYETECNAYKQIAGYVAENAELSEDSNSYFLILDKFYSSDYTSEYSVFANYYPDDGEILIGLSINGENYVYFTLTEDVSGVYEWCYFDDYDNDLIGTVNGATFYNSTLSYKDHNITDAELREAVQGLASSMMNLLCGCLTDCFADIGVTAADIGFVKYA